MRQRDSPFVSFCGGQLVWALELRLGARGCDRVLRVIARAGLEQRRDAPGEKTCEQGDDRSDKERDENGALGLLVGLVVSGVRVCPFLLAGIANLAILPRLPGDSYAG